MLEINDVRAGYDRTTVLHEVTVAVPDDGVAAVLGHNGAGKSTLLRTAMGLIRPSHGTVLLDGEDITRLAPHQRVARGMAYVPRASSPSPSDHCREPPARRRRFPARRRPRRHRRGPRPLPGPPRTRPPPRRTPLRRPAPATRHRPRPRHPSRILLLDEPTEGIQPSVVAEIETTVLSWPREAASASSSSNSTSASPCGRPSATTSWRRAGSHRRGGGERVRSGRSGRH